MLELFWKKNRIADIALGKVFTIKGEIRTTSPLLLPPSKTPCVYYSLIEERFGKGARGTGRPLWFPNKMACKSSMFSVSDGTNEIAVHEIGERFVVKGAHKESGLVNGNRKRRYFASLLMPGDIVVIRGYVDAKEKTDEPYMTAPSVGVLKVKVVRRAPANQ